MQNFRSRSLAHLARHRRDDARAANLLTESLHLILESDHTDRRRIVTIAFCLAGFAAIWASHKENEKAARLLGAVEALLEDSDTPHFLYRICRAEYKRTVATVRAHLDEATFTAAWAAGQAMTIEQAIAEAQPVTLSAAKSSITSVGSRDPNALTAREKEVLRLLAAGMSDAQVAERLVISRRTVSTHLTAIYSKLGVNSRSAATRYALDHQLV